MIEFRLRLGEERRREIYDGADGRLAAFLSRSAAGGVAPLGDGPI